MADSASNCSSPDESNVSSAQDTYSLESISERTYRVRPLTLRFPDGRREFSRPDSTTIDQKIKTTLEFERLAALSVRACVSSVTVLGGGGDRGMAMPRRCIIPMVHLIVVVL